MLYAVWIANLSKNMYHQYLGVIFKSSCAGCNIASSSSSSYTSKVKNVG